MKIHEQRMIRSLLVKAASVLVSKLRIVIYIKN